MANTKYPQYRGLTVEQARSVIRKERNKEEPDGELIDFCKRRIGRIQASEKSDVTLIRKRIEKALKWNSR